LFAIFKPKGQTIAINQNKQNLMKVDSLYYVGISDGNEIFFHINRLFVEIFGHDLMALPVVFWDTK